MYRNHKNKVDYGSMYFYREFLKYYKELKIPQKTYTLILKTFFELVIKKIISETYRFFFPGLGLFYLIKEEQKIKKDKLGNIKLQASINWPETKKLIKKTGDKTKKVYYINDHSHRYIYKITWDKRKVEFINKNFYTFIINKKHRQYLFNKIINSIKPLNSYAPWYQSGK